VVELRALLIGTDRSVDDLADTLSGLGVVVQRPGPAPRPARSGQPPDLVLVPSSLTPAEVAALVAGVAAGAPPPVVVYLDGDATALADHIHAGRDYLVPPYLAAQVRARIPGTRAEDANLLRVERELQIAWEIQSGFLPRALPARDGWELEARLRPAHEVCGDFYDGFEMVDGRRVGFLVADVCDKGVSAALFAALMRTLLRSFAEQNVPTAWIDERVDRRDLPGIGETALHTAVEGTSEYMIRNHLEQGYFATVFFGVLDPGSGGLTYVNGGHNPPVLRAAGGGQTLLAPTGPAVGLLPDGRFETAKVVLDPGDLLFVYSDGITEAKNEQGEFFTKDRLLALLRSPVASAGELLDRVAAALRAHAGTADQYDDITMLVLRRRPGPG